MPPCGAEMETGRYPGQSLFSGRNDMRKSTVYFNDTSVEILERIGGVTGKSNSDLVNEALLLLAMDIRLIFREELAAFFKDR